MGMKATPDTLAAIGRLQRLPGKTLPAMRAGARMWAEGVQQATQQRAPGGTRNRYPHRIAVDPQSQHVTVSWRLNYIPKWLEYGTKPHLVAARGFGRISTRKGVQRFSRTTAAARAKAAAKGKAKARVLRFRDGTYAAYAVHPGYKGRRFLGDSISARRTLLGEQVRRQVNAAWRAG